MLLFAGPAGAQYPPPPGPTCTLSVTVVPPGGSLTVSCGGFLPGSPWTITFFSQPEVLASGTADANGNINATVTIPGDARPGDHILRVSGIGADGDPVVIDPPITVVAAAAAPEAPGLAVTGGNITVGILMLVGLLAAGAAACSSAGAARESRARRNPSRAGVWLPRSCPLCAARGGL